jgi:hypothetical protein
MGEGGVPLAGLGRRVSSFLDAPLFDIPGEEGEDDEGDLLDALTAGMGGVVPPITAPPPPGRRSSTARSTRRSSVGGSMGLGRLGDDAELYADLDIDEAARARRLSAGMGVDDEGEDDEDEGEEDDEGGAGAAVGGRGGGGVGADGRGAVSGDQSDAGSDDLEMSLASGGGGGGGGGGGDGGAHHGAGSSRRPSRRSSLGSSYAKGTQSVLDFLASLLPRPSSKVQLIADALCSDLFRSKYPTAGRRRRARASAFHHVLTLASDRRLALHQPRHVPFAEIEVRRGAAFSVDMPEVMGVAATIPEGDEARSDEEDEDEVADEDEEDGEDGEDDDEAVGAASEEDDDDGQEGDQKEGQGASDGDEGDDGDAEMEGADAEMEDDDM